MRDTKYNHRHIARIVIEMETPIAISTGKDDVLTDSTIIKDFNGLPYIPGTSITGVIRNAIDFLENNEKKEVFGFQEAQSGKGSKIIFTDGVMMGTNGKAIDGVQQIDFADEFYSMFQTLPIRQHVSINEKGVAKKTGKFDEEIVYKGTRFCFEMELISEKDNKELFNKIIGTICSNYLRIGGGTRKGFGKAKVIKELCGMAHLDLKKTNDLELYLKKSSCLSDNWAGFQAFTGEETKNENWETNSIALKPLDFFLFSSGFKEDDADMAPVYEQFIYWDTNNHPKFSKKCVLIPATSIKGALAHRVAYHWNKINEKYADQKEGLIGDENPAVCALFGTSENTSRIGNVIISDIYSVNTKTKLHSHVKIDRFTGGTINSGLFFEKTTLGKDDVFNLEIIINKNAFKDKTIEKALKLTIDDLRKGLLPLGGGVNRGNGIFIENK